MPDMPARYALTEKNSPPILLLSAWKAFASNLNHGNYQNKFKYITAKFTNRKGEEGYGDF